MKIVIAQQNYEIADFTKNFSKISKAVDSAIRNGAHLIVFSEMTMGGHPAHDYLLMDDFIHKCHQQIHQLLPLSQKIHIILGGPDAVRKKETSVLYNAAFVLSKGKIIHTVHKQQLTATGILNECKYFTPGNTLEPVRLGNKNVLITIGEDLWYPYCNRNSAGDMKSLTGANVDLIVNLAGIPFNYSVAGDKKLGLKDIAQQSGVPVIHCNSAGSQTDVIFSGNSIVADAAGNLICELPHFEEETAQVEWREDGSFDKMTIEPFELSRNQLSNPKELIADLNIALIHDALVLGIRDYFEKNGFTKAILGSSGGLDSAVTLALACKALGSENVLAILMPSIYSTAHSVSDAEQLSIHLNNPYQIIPIKDIYDQFLTALKPHFRDLPFNVAEENIQARTRGVLLMAMANKFGHILLNTSNKSELSVGYGTLYGDLAGGISVLGDCYKLQVFELAKYINLHEEVIPTHIITKPPSAELRPEQKDSDSLPQYDILDPILYQYLERLENATSIVAQGYDETTVHRIINMIHRNEYKRHQFCPILPVSSRSFANRPMPVVSNYIVETQ